MISIFEFRKRQQAKEELSGSIKLLKKKIYYEKKKKYFESLLTKTEEYQFNDIVLRFLDNVITILSSVEEKEQSLNKKLQKQEILKRLITLSENLAINPENEFYANEFRNLENQLASYLGLYDSICAVIMNDDTAYLRQISEYKESIKRIKKVLSTIVKKTKHTYIRDLRQLLRSIINYLFKQPMEEDNNKNGFYSVLSNSFLLFKNNEIDGTRYHPRNFRAIMCER